MNELLLQLVILQIGIPVVLIILNVVLPSTSIFAWILRSGLIAGLTIYFAFAGLWLFPPWWTPYLLLLLHSVVVVIFYHRTKSRLTQRRGVLSSEWIFNILALTGLSLLGLDVINGRSLPASSIDLTMPLGPGQYLVVNGGTTLALNTHLATLNLERAAAYRGQSYAVDIIGINRFGFYADAISPKQAERYEIYATKVIAPCTGQIVYQIDGVPNMPVPQMDSEHMLGNGVIIACDNYYVVIGHLAPGSTQVQENQFVQQGQVVGLVGNSGNTNGPHLHIHVQRGMNSESPLAGEPEWFTINGQFLLRNQRFEVDN